MPGDEVAGDQSAEGSGAAGDQDRARAGGVPLPAGGVRRLCPGQPGNRDDPTPDGQPGLTSGQGSRRRRREGRLGGFVVVQVGQHEAARVLGLRGAHQPPHRGVGGRTDVIVRAGGDNPAGHQDQARIGETGVL